MFDFGDELTLESFRIPCLIWIQFIVLLLLLAFLFCFTFIASDPSHDTAAASASTIQSLTNHHSISVINPLHNTPNQSIKGEITRSGSCTEIVREGIAEREASSLYFLHPCYYYRLARVAFLKCLGLDSTSESSDDNSASTQKHRKKKKES